MVLLLVVVTIYFLKPFKEFLKAENTQNPEIRKIKCSRIARIANS